MKRLLGAFDKDCANVFKSVWARTVPSAHTWQGCGQEDHVAAFIKVISTSEHDMSMLELTPDFIKEFAVFLSTNRGLQNGTYMD